MVGLTAASTEECPVESTEGCPAASMAEYLEGLTVVYPAALMAEYQEGLTVVYLAALMAEYQEGLTVVYLEGLMAEYPAAWLVASTAVWSAGCRGALEESSCQIRGVFQWGLFHRCRVGCRPVGHRLGIQVERRRQRAEGCFLRRLYPRWREED